MRTEKGTEDLITGIIISEKDKPRPEREAAKEIIRTLKEENNLNIPPVMGRSEQLTAFAEWLKDNHSIEIHDMILKDYIAYGG